MATGNRERPNGKYNHFDKKTNSEDEIKLKTSSTKQRTLLMTDFNCWFVKALKENNVFHPLSDGLCESHNRTEGMSMMNCRAISSRYDLSVKHGNLHLNSRHSEDFQSNKSISQWCQQQSCLFLTAVIIYFLMDSALSPICLLQLTETAPRPASKHCLALWQLPTLGHIVGTHRSPWMVAHDAVARLPRW